MGCNAQPSFPGGTVVLSRQVTKLEAGTAGLEIGAEAGALLGVPV